MNYLSTTDLRTKTAKLRDSLKKGESTYILHRSKVIGVIEPYENMTKVFTLEKLRKLHKAFPPAKIHYTYEQREKIWAKHLMEKYGKSVS